MSQHQQQLEAARTTHKHTCLLLPLCGLCRAHVAKTKVRMRLVVSSMCHAGTNKQHSIARGGGGCGAATRTVTHPPSPQPPAQTSSHQPAFGGKRPVVWLCETRIPFSLSTNTHTHLMPQRWRGRKGRGGGGRRSGMGGAAISSANGCSQSHTASQLHYSACT